MDPNMECVVISQLATRWTTRWMPGPEFRYYSLYGKTRKPTPESLEDVDVIVYDIQDIGVRSYTFISTMGLVMEAAAEQGKEVVILDRPNPLGGRRVEGPLVEEGYSSFVSQYAIPYVYGLTCGELAQLLNGEGMLSGGISCQLTVVPMEGWTRDMTFDRTGLAVGSHFTSYSSIYNGFLLSRHRDHR